MRAAAVAAAALLCATGASAQTLVVQADRAIITPGREIAPATITIRDGRIAAVRQGTADGATLRAAVVMMGLIDARTTAGLSGLVGPDDDADDRGGPVRPELRAEDGYDLADPLLSMALRGGVAIVQAGPGDANSIGGQSGIFLTSAPSVAGATIRSPSALIVSLTEDAKETYAERNRLPTTRMANVSLIRQAFVDAGRPSSGQDAGRAVLARALADSLPVYIAARRSDEIATALRIAREFEIDVVVTGATEAAWVTDALHAARGVLLEPTDLARAADGDATAAEAAVALHAAGIPFAFATGDVRAGMTLLDLARTAVRAGLPEEAALAALTTVPASMLGISARAGTLEDGRDAHLVLLDGDPFDARTGVLAVVVGGRVAWERR